MYMIRDYLPLLYEAIQQDVEQLIRILLRLYTLMDKNGKSRAGMRRKTSLTYSELCTNEGKRKLHNFKKAPVWGFFGIDIFVENGGGEDV